MMDSEGSAHQFRPTWSWLRHLVVAVDATISEENEAIRKEGHTLSKFFNWWSAPQRVQDHCGWTHTSTLTEAAGAVAVSKFDQK